MNCNKILLNLYLRIIFLFGVNFPKNLKMSETLRVPIDLWRQLVGLISGDEVVSLSRIVDTTQINKKMDIYRPDQTNFAQPPLLYFAVALKSQGCVRWLLDNGADPNMKMLNGLSLLFVACKENYDYLSLVKAGARVEMPWEDIFGYWDRDTTYKAVSRMFLLGLKLPEKRGRYIPPVCYETYNILLEREAACRRACYAFLLGGRLLDKFPRDLVRWILSQYVLPSKRKSIWSPNVKIPDRFELLDTF
jgi:hypothetical protein